MREILFRGKRIDNGEWVAGYYRRFFSFNYNKVYIYIDEFETNESFEVDPETIGQYTGLTDKNGTNIFEGDVVHCVATFDNADMVVIYEEGEFHMVLCEKFKTYKPLSGFYSIRNFIKEVIGNIHDNPELLEGEETNE